MEQKEFQSLRAQLALAGCSLWRTAPSDGHVSYFVATADGTILHMWDACDVERFLAQLKGQL
ncbi:MAG: hypothetical protein FGM35_05445 [Rhodocyclaceae bacterium]|nr:hypothetical protein [Rhodocyclaceae bacterium]